MTIEEFKIKYDNLIERGVIRFTNKHPYLNESINRKKINPFEKKYIVLDRFAEDNKTILAEKNELINPRYDVYRIGYRKYRGLDVYMKIN